MGHKHAPGETTNDIQAVLFDMDGLMVDSEPHSLASWEAIMGERNILLDAATRSRVLGLRAEETAALLKDTFRLPETPMMLAEMKTEYQIRHLEGNAPLMPGLYELLDAVDRRGFKKAVATSSVRRYTEAMLRMHDLLNRFSVIITGDEVQHGKPAPDLFLLAARCLDIRVDRCLVLEDSLNGVRAARAAGMRCIAVSSDRSVHPHLSEAKHLVLSLHDVIPLLPRP